jgi:hypothetical protein
VEASDALEEYLSSAPILGIAGPIVGGGGHPGKQRLLLAGGVQVIAKPEVEAQEVTKRMVPREAAAWQVAKALGFIGLVAATVLRQVPHPDLGEVTASVQVFWPDGHQFCAPLDVFPEEDLWRAAVFDALVVHEDRGYNNWLAVPAPGGTEPPQVKLIDNGYAFDCQGERNQPNSTFYSQLENQELPEHIEDGLNALVDGWPIAELDRLVEHEVGERVLQRAQALLQHQVLHL